MHTRNLRPSCSLAVAATLCLLLAGGALQAQTTAPPGIGTPVVTPQQPAKVPTTPVPLLTLMPQNGLTRIGAGSGRFNIDDIDASQIPRLERTVTLKNETTQPIVIGQVRGSCGCETIQLTKDGKDANQTTLLPGEQAELHVAIRITSAYSGEVHKSVWAFAPGDPRPIATLELVLSTRASVVFTPTQLNFGKINRGSAASLPLTVGMEALLTEEGALPRLVSSNPDVSVVQEGRPQPIQRHGKAWMEQTYSVTLRSQASSGPLYGSLRFEVTPSSLMNSSPTRSAFVAQVTLPGGFSQNPQREVGAPPPRLVLLSASMRVPLTGEVTGGLTAAPRSVYLGTLPAGKGARRQVVVTSSSMESLHGLTLATNSPWLTAILAQDSTGNVSAPTKVQLIDITLNPRTPLGTLQAQVIVTTAAGEKLLLPVIVEVTASP